MSNLTDLTGLVAALFVILAFFSHRPKPLRIYAIFSNVLFVCYAADVGLMPVLMLHAALLPLNVFRLLQLPKKKPPRAAISPELACDPSRRLIAPGLAAGLRMSSFEKHGSDKCPQPKS